MSGADAVLEATSITKSFPGVKALQGVGLRVGRGRLHALLGENGAGKSTLMNILAGVFPPDAGEIRLESRPVHFRNPREARAAGIAIIFQELNQIPDLSVAENIFLGREPLTAAGLVDFGRMHRDTTALLAGLGLQVDPGRAVGTLRVGEQQLVEIAKALSFQAKVLILDEPTSALSEQEIEVLFRIIADLKLRGVGLIYITHKLDELPRIADDITILRDGQFVATQPFAGLPRSEMIRLMVGREWSGADVRTPTPPGEEALRLTGLSLPHPRRPGDFLVRDVSFAVRRGEIVGLFGLMGAGRTELLEVIFGRHAGAASGTIQLAGQTVDCASPRYAIAAGLALAPEDRKAEGLVLPMTVGENITLAGLEQCTRLGLLRPKLEAGIVGDFINRLRIKTPSGSQIVRHLSGGNQQKAVLAKWLLTKPQVLLLDEPTRGIDVNAKREIYTLLDELVRQGMGVLLVSSELPEILAVADRILVLSGGRLTGEFSRADATEENILHAALPVAHAS
jgi:ABC-type sugar transport system ATPase subunit